MSTISVKPRAGNKSASLTRTVSLMVKRGKGTRRVSRVLTVGSVDYDAELSSPSDKLRLYGAKHGEHAELSPADLEKIRSWQATARGEVSAQPTLASLAAQLDELLARPHCHACFADSTASPRQEALAQLDDAVHAAINDLTQQVQALRACHVELSLVKHADPDRPGGPTELDALQARANYIRKTLFRRFEDALKDLGLMVSKSGGRASAASE